MRFGNSSWASISGPIAARSRSSELLGRPRSRTAGCRSRRAESPTRDRRRSACPVPSSPPDGKSLETVEAAAHVDRAGQLGGDRRRDRPRHGAESRTVLLGPAAAAQVEDRLAGPVAGELGLGAVGIEDPQLGDELRVLAAARATGSRQRRPRSAGRRATRSAARSAPREASPPRGSGSRCPAPATSQTLTVRAAYWPKLQSDDLGGHLGVAARPVRSIV